MPEEDLAHLAVGEKIGVDMVALSFVRSPDDIAFVREHTRLPLIAKIEKPQAVERAEEIIRAADCVMVARGDLGIELPIERVPIVQKELLATAGRLARPSITATQMLDSMVASTRPTRAEVADVANAILDGTDAVMLSQETAIGAYPVEAIAMMDAIARETERAAPYRRWNEHRVHRDARDPSYTVAYSVCMAARELELDAIVVPTLSGRSARLVSAHRPTVPIYALSPGPRDRAPLRPDVGRARRVPAQAQGHRGAAARRLPARRRAGLVPARHARRGDRGPAQRRAGLDLAVSGPGAVAGALARASGAPSMRPRRALGAQQHDAGQRHHDERHDRDDRLRRGEVVERAAERRVGEGARRDADRRRRRERRQARPASGRRRS